MQRDLDGKIRARRAWLEAVAGKHAHLGLVVRRGQRNPGVRPGQVLGQRALERLAHVLFHVDEIIVIVNASQIGRAFFAGDKIAPLNGAAAVAMQDTVNIEKQFGRPAWKRNGCFFEKRNGARPQPAELVVRFGNDENASEFGVEGGKGVKRNFVFAERGKQQQIKYHGHCLWVGPAFPVCRRDGSQRRVVRKALPFLRANIPPAQGVFKRRRHVKRGRTSTRKIVF